MFQRDYRWWDNTDHLRLAEGGDRAAYDGVLRNATAVDQAARQCSYDFECIGTGRPGAPCAVALARGHDVLIHLPRMEAARWRGRESTTA
ncbi:hypothetical protein ACFVY4_02970 [Streptomyces sp. NPDC058299]|uniref:hypothetical protein n=1 Tax=Streptomyces sp. NPDC058299 TaxID=3346435 RepID=UPI0036EBFDF0